MTFGRQGGQGPAEVVGDRQDVLGETLDAELALALDILLGATAHVLGLGQRTQQLVLQVGLLGLELFQRAGAVGRACRLEVVVGCRLRRGAAHGWIAGHW